MTKILISKYISITAVITTAVMLFITTSCNTDDDKSHPEIENRDSMPILMSNGVSTLISDSGIISYKIIAENWFIFDKKDPPHWSFEKGLFIEKYNKEFNVEAFISCDTAYYYDKKKLWELRGRVFVKNMKGESFKTTLLFWDQVSHEIYSDKYMQIDGENKLAGYNFRSNEQLTDYRIHSSQGDFPVEEEEKDTSRQVEVTTQHNISKDTVFIKKN